MQHLQKLSLPLAVAALSALGMAFSSGAQAQTTTPITVVNGDFETDTATNTNGNTPTGYTFNGNPAGTAANYAVGTQDATYGGGNGFPGETGKYGFINAGSGGFNLEQVVSYPTTVGDTYTLTANVYTLSGAYGLVALSNGTDASSTGAVQSNGAFLPFTTSFVATTAASNLFINLYLTNSAGAAGQGDGTGQANFDNIQLTQVAPAPEPAAWVGLAIGAMGLGALSLRARRRSLA